MSGDRVEPVTAHADVQLTLSEWTGGSRHLIYSYLGYKFPSWLASSRARLARRNRKWNL